MRVCYAREAMDCRNTLVIRVLVLGAIVLCSVCYDAIHYSPFRGGSDDVLGHMHQKRDHMHRFEVPVGWWTPWVDSTSRIYQPWNESGYGWCFLTNRSTQAPSKTSTVHGLLYVKSHKASSSTCAGVNMAIAHHVAKRKMLLEQQEGRERRTTNTSSLFCEHYDRHYFHKNKSHAKRRVRSTSLLWTFVRNPVSRDLSQLYHFMITRAGLDPEKDVALLLQSLKRSKGRQVEYLSLRVDDVKVVSTNDTNYEGLLSTSLHEKLFEEYDFIGVVERMAQSLAVMTILWDLDPTDVIVLSAKQSSNGDSYDDGLFQDTCFKMIPAPRNMSDLQPELAHYLQSKDYIEHNPDFLLYYAAHESLDRTIDAIGRAKVEERTELIMKLQALAEEKCQKEAIYPCSNEGNHQTELSKKNCYLNDAGCGYACVDRVMSEYRNGQVRVL